MSTGTGLDFLVLFSEDEDLVEFPEDSAEEEQVPVAATASASDPTALPTALIADVETDDAKA